MTSLKERKIRAVYNWLLSQKTPSEIASLFVHTATWKVLNMIIEENGIKVPKE